MDYHTKKDIEKSRNVLIDSNDPRFNYTFHQKEDIDEILDNEDSRSLLNADDFDDLRINIMKITERGY